MEHQRTTSNPLLVIANAAKIAITDWPATLVAFLFLTIPPIWAGAYLPEDDATRFSAFMGIAGLVPQILLTERALWRHGLMQTDYDKRPSYFPRAFGQSMIAGLGIILGLVMLVIPGLFLISRWSVSLPVLISRNEGIVESLRTSWQLTADHIWLCLLSVLCVWAPLVASAVVIILFSGLPLLAESIVTETILSIAILLSWFVSVALYAEITASQKVG